MRSMRPNRWMIRTGFPVNIVIDEEIAVLKVLPLTDAIRRNEKVDLLRLVRETRKPDRPAV